jgi:Kef-type K+ transport system membrane component KefB
LAVALTFSSTVVVVKLLEEKQEFGLLHGRLAVGILLFQDLVALVLLTFLGSFDPQTELELGVIAASVAQSLAAMILLVVVVIVLSRYGLPRPFAWAARSPSALLIWSLCWCFFIVAAAHVLSLSPETGAFLAGIALAQLPYNHDLRRRVRPLMDFFVAVFFVTLGAQMHLGSAMTQWPVASVLILFAIVGKFIILMTVLARCGFGQRAAHQASLSLSQISEFSLVIVALAVKENWIGKDTLSMVGVVGLVTFSISACAIVYSNRLYILAVRWDLLRFFRAREETEPEERHVHRHGHIIVVGINSLGKRLLHQFCARGESVLAIDTDPAKLQGLPCDTLLGNVEYLSLLEEADLSRARLLVSALQIEATNDLLAYRCRTADVPCAILVVDLSLTDNLLEMDVDYLMVPKVDGIKLQLRELEKRGFLPT